VTQPTSGEPEFPPPSGPPLTGPPLTGPQPTGPAYPGPPPPGYPPPPPAGYPPLSGYAVYPVYADPLAKSRLTAGLLGIFLGALGVHRFYLGYTSIGVLQILVTIATCGIGGLWGVVEGILILGGSGIKTDAEGRPLRP
jgi:hypothetical protein